MNAFSTLTLALFNALGVSKQALEDAVRWAKEQAPELGKPADLFLEKLRELVPDQPEKLLIFAADAWREAWSEDPGYSSSGGLGAG